MSPSPITFDPPIQRFVYISRLAPDRPLDAVSLILRQSRASNRSLGISGALVFDGERFCQLIEGTPEAVHDLAGRIERDPRHCSFRVLHDAAAATPRLCARWQAGYCENEALDPLDRRDRIDPEQALAAFIQLLPGCDLSV